MPFPTCKDKIELSYNLAMQLFQNIIAESAPLSNVWDMILYPSFLELIVCLSLQTVNYGLFLN